MSVLELIHQDLNYSTFFNMYPISWVVLNTNTNNNNNNNNNKKKKKNFILHNIVQSTKLVIVISVATRTKLTPSQDAAFTEAFVQEDGGDTSKVCTPYALADKSRWKI